MNIKNILSIILLIAIFLGTSVLAIFTAQKITTQNPHSVDSPDFFMTNVSYTKYNHEGKIHNQLKTKKITHFSTDNTFLFEKPDVIIHKKNEKPWHIKANNGKSKKGKTKIYLKDNVKMTRDAGKNNCDFNIITDKLIIFPDNKFAQTKSQIKIIQNKNITKAVGAELDFKTGILKLLSKVEGLYQSN